MVPEGQKTTGRADTAWKQWGQRLVDLTVEGSVGRILAQSKHLRYASKVNSGVGETKDTIQSKHLKNFNTNLSKTYTLVHICVYFIYLFLRDGLPQPRLASNYVSEDDHELLVLLLQLFKCGDDRCAPHYLTYMLLDIKSRALCKPGNHTTNGTTSLACVACLLKINQFVLFNVYRCFVCMYICMPHAYLVPREARRGHQIPWNWVTDNCELLCGCQEPDLGLLQEKPALNIRAISLGHCTCIFFFFLFFFQDRVFL